MKTLKVYGYSDDLVEASGIDGCDEFSAYCGNHPALSGHMKIISDEATISIYAIYNGHWCFAVGPEDGDYDLMPPWAITRIWGTERRYSETLEIEVPDDARLIWLKKND